MKFPRTAVMALALTAAPLLAQQSGASSSSTYSYDINGRRVGGVTIDQSATPGQSARQQTTRNLNGRSVPIDTVEERVISDSGGVRLVERIVRRFDANGNPGPPEKAQIEERKNPDGSFTTATTVLRTDINGRLQIAEKSVAETRKSGDTTTVLTTVQRPSMNGGFDLAERKETTRRELPDGSMTERSTVFQKNNNGALYEAARESAERRLVNGQIVENNATYEATNGGQPQLVRQTVARTTRDANGNERKEVDVFVGDGGARVGAGQPVLREQQLIEKVVSPSGAVERLSVRRPAGDSNRMGQYQKVEETVCSGKCGFTPPPDPAAPKPAQPSTGQAAKQ